MSTGLILISMTTQDKMAVSSGDFGLKRLFRPALDSLSIQEQLLYYSARNLAQSRSSRLGSSRPNRTSPQPRKRIIDASLYSPKDEGKALTHTSEMWTGMRHLAVYLYCYIFSHRNFHCRVPTRTYVIPTCMKGEEG